MRHALRWHANIAACGPHVLTMADVFIITNTTVIIADIPLQSVDAQLALQVRRVAVRIWRLLLQLHASVLLAWSVCEVAGAQVLVMRQWPHAVMCFVLLLLQLVQEISVADLVRCGQVLRVWMLMLRQVTATVAAGMAVGQLV